MKLRKKIMIINFENLSKNFNRFLLLALFITSFWIDRDYSQETMSVIGALGILMSIIIILPSFVLLPLKEKEFIKVEKNILKNYYKFVFLVSFVIIFPVLVFFSYFVLLSILYSLSYYLQMGDLPEFRNPGGFISFLGPTYYVFTIASLMSVSTEVSRLNIKIRFLFVLIAFFTAVSLFYSNNTYLLSFYYLILELIVLKK